MKIEDEVKILGWYQIIGGLAGFWVTIWYILQHETLTSQTGIFLLGVLGLYSFSVICGMVLLKNTRKGIKLSMVNQLLQIFSFALFGYAYQYHSGLRFSLGIDFTQNLLLKFDVSLSNFQYAYKSNNDEAFILINIVPMVIIYLLNNIDNVFARTGQEIPKTEMN